MLVRDIEDWGPDAATLEQVREKLYTLPDAECVVVPLVQPRKIQGWWRDGGEEVVTLSPVYEVGPRQLDYAAARNAATVRAEDELQNTYHGQGTIAYSVVDPDGTFSTFEYRGRQRRGEGGLLMSQFGILLKSADPAHPDDERRIPVSAEDIEDAAQQAVAMAGQLWRVHQITDLRRD